MIGGMARVAQDVPPFMIVAGDPAFVSGLNSVGSREPVWLRKYAVS